MENNDLGALMRSSKPFLEALRRSIAQDDAQSLRNAVDRLMAAAARGEPWAITALADRLDGKPQQGTTISAPDGGPVSIAVTGIPGGST